MFIVHGLGGVDMIFIFPIVTVKSSIEDMCLVQGKEQKIGENCLAVLSWTVWPL